MSEDGSNGYEGIASIYIAGRGTRARAGDSVGAATVRAWAQAFPPGATVLDLGSGPGEPSTRILRDAGLTWVTEAEDEGGNHYYFVEKRQPSRYLEGFRRDEPKA